MMAWRAFVDASRRREEVDVMTNSRATELIVELTR